MNRRKRLLVCSLICLFSALSASAADITLTKSVGTSVRVTIVVTKYPDMTATMQTINFTGVASTQTFTLPPPPASLGSTYYKITTMTFTYGAGPSVSFGMSGLPNPGETKMKTLPLYDPYAYTCLFFLAQDLSGNYNFWRDGGSGCGL